LRASEAPAGAHDSTQDNTQEQNMNLHDVVRRREPNRLALLQEDAEWSELIPELDWDDAEAQDIASELIGRQHEED
jgi:hypothetical protein